MEKEIMASNIESAGKCLIPDGTIIYSAVTAKNGIFANNIGSKGAKPSKLGFGIDQLVQRKIKYAKKKVILQQKELEQPSENIEKKEDGRNHLETL